MSLRMTQKAAERLVGRRGGQGAGYPARSKFNARRTTVDGFTFDSQAEARRYQQLVIRGIVGQIRNLELQPRFDLHVNGRRVGAYVADFRYEEQLGIDTVNGRDRWQDVIEDVKGVKTPVYNLKKRLFEAEYGLSISEVQ